MNEDQNEDRIAMLIRTAGKRPQVDTERMARVRAAVHEEWRGEVSHRHRTRYLLAAAAMVVLILGGMLLMRQEPTAPSPALQVVETPNALPKSIVWNGNTLRLDGRTRVVLLSDTAARLERGTLYFSTERAGSKVSIETPYGEVHDLGTQFEVQLLPSNVQVRVREGRVVLRGTSAAAGQMLVGRPDRVELVPAAADWSWVERAAPPIRLEGMRLEAVLRRVAREKGLTLDWHATSARREIVLHGDVPFTPDEALAAATAAAGVTARVAGDRLVVEEKR
jgi:ferric-dicitrate binding protein FerR (iron transport regulator)